MQTANFNKVLIIDDDRDLAELLEEVLTMKGFEVHTAQDGDEGLRLLKQDHPDVIILDVEMPHVSGPEMMYRMILHNAGMERIPVLLVSGVENLLNLAGKVGTPYFLNKPYDIDDMCELLARALREKAFPHPTWDSA